MEFSLKSKVFFLHSVTKKLNSFGPPEFVLLSFITRLFSNNNVSSAPTETLNCSDKVEPCQGGYHPCWRPQNASPSNRKRRAPISSDYSNTHVDQKKKYRRFESCRFFFLFSIIDHRLTGRRGPNKMAFFNGTDASAKPTLYVNRGSHLRPPE
jgi:hypothetical protein